MKEQLCWASSLFHWWILGNAGAVCGSWLAEVLAKSLAWMWLFVFAEFLQGRASPLGSAGSASAAVVGAAGVPDRAVGEAAPRWHSRGSPGDGSAQWRAVGCPALVFSFPTLFFSHEQPKKDQTNNVRQCRRGRVSFNFLLYNYDLFNEHVDVFSGQRYPSKPIFSLWNSSGIRLHAHTHSCDLFKLKVIFAWFFFLQVLLAHWC